MLLTEGNLCCYKERGCYPGWGFSGGTPGSSGRMSSGARSQNAPLGAQCSAVRRLTDCGFGLRMKRAAEFEDKSDGIRSSAPGRGE